MQHKRGTTTQTESGGAPDVECVDGVVQGTTAPCVDDRQQVACENGSAAPDAARDGECENGKDAVTGAACTDAPEVAAASNVDPNKRMSVPATNPPEDVRGCDDGSDGETQDD